MPTDLLMIGSVPVAVRQLIAAGNNYGGVAPSLGGTPLVPKQRAGWIEYANASDVIVAGDAGGLFRFGTSILAKPQVLRLTGVAFYFGGTQNSWSFSLAEDGHPDIPIWTGTNEVSIFKGACELSVVVSPGQYFKLITNNSTGAMEATVYVAGMDGADGLV